MSSTLHGRLRHGSGGRVLPNLMPGEETLGWDATMGRARMLGPLILDPSGITEGYGVDRLARGDARSASRARWQRSTARCGPLDFSPTVRPEQSPSSGPIMGKERHFRLLPCKVPPSPCPALIGSWSTWERRSGHTPYTPHAAAPLPNRLPRSLSWCRPPHGRRCAGDANEGDASPGRCDIGPQAQSGCDVH